MADFRRDCQDSARPFLPIPARRVPAPCARPATPLFVLRHVRERVSAGAGATHPRIRLRERLMRQLRLSVTSPRESQLNLELGSPLSGQENPRNWLPQYGRRRSRQKTHFCSSFQQN